MDTNSIPSITLAPIESSQLEAIGHDAATRTLAVRFKGKEGQRGPLYHYADVTTEQFNEMVAAPSSNSWFIHNVKRKADRHPYKRIDESAAQA